jgi:pimeloyl-ACP methyl ester carboxylesterase
LTTPAWADRYWTAADGLRLHARDYAGASGPAKAPALCIHGLTRNARDFEDLAPRIAATGRRVLVLDVRGRGGSARDPNPANYNPATYAGDVTALMSSLALAKAQFIGTSMGGLITMALAGSRPDLIAGVVLNDVGPALAAEGLKRIGGYVGQSPGARTWDEAAEHARRQNAHALPHYGPGEWDRMARRLFRQEGDGLELDYDLAIADGLKAAVDKPAPEIWPLFTAMSHGKPLTIIRGGRSDLLDEKTVARMRQLAPQAAYAEVPDVGHAPMLDEPEAIAAIEAHLDRAP